MTTKHLYKSYLNEYFHKNLPISDYDSIDIHKAQSAGKLFELLRKPIQFCYVNKRTLQYPCKISRKDIKEWTA